MRSLPAGWPNTYDLVQEAPTVYLRLLDTAWPPASVVDGESLPAGTTIVDEWSINCDLDAPLLPGQINASPKLTIADASCTIPQPKGGLLAPWRTGPEATPPRGRCELVASYDGPSGSTAFLLGRFVLDPIKGRLSDPFLTVTMVQDLIRLRRDHTIPSRKPGGFGGGAWANSIEIVQYAAASCGFGFTSEGALLSGLEYCYFPRHTDQLDAMQQIVSANLGALFLSMDGTTVRVLGPEYLKGTGAVVETLDVMDSFEDLSWSQDPNATVDRVEVTYVPPIWDNGPLGPVPFATGSVWTAPKGQGIPSGAWWSFEFDPGSSIAPVALGGTFQIVVNANREGTDVQEYLDGNISERSSGNFAVSIYNHTSLGKYLVLPFDVPGGAYRGWGVSKGTPSFIPGSQDRATESESSRTLSWGVGADGASNTLSFNLGRLVQHDVYAADIFNRVVARVTSPSFVVDDVRVVPNLGRELGDTYRIQAPEVGFDQRAIVTGIKLSGKNADGSGGGAEIVQSLSLAIMPLVPGD
ncbi:MAG: hypothetical protein ABWX92_07585 [Mycetocola sp.]